VNVPDLINGFFELGGGILCWFNVKKLLKDKRIEGVYWPIQGFFTAWGLYNTFFYSNLSQWCSFYGGIFMVIANLTWVVLAWHFSRKNE
jgi:hypothetical protein